MKPKSEPGGSDRLGTMEQVFLGVLRKGPTWSPEDTPEVSANQRLHLALLDRLRQEGILLLSGPIPQGKDFRGFVILDVDDEARVHSLFKDDAHMQSERLVLDVYPWLVAAAALAKLRPG